MKSLTKSQGALRRASLGAAASVLALAGCGGGSGGGMPAPGAGAANSVPAAASTSVAALVGWASQLPQSEVAVPLGTATFTPPVSDTTEPMPILL